MKNKSLAIILAVGVLALLLVLGCLLYTALKPNTVTLTFKPVEQVNYNNYIQDNWLDIKGDQLAWQDSSLLNRQLTVVTDDGEASALSGVTAPFQLLEDRIVFNKNSTLLCRMNGTKEDQILAKDVASFVALPEAIVYQSEDNLYISLLSSVNWGIKVPIDRLTSVLFPCRQ